MQGQAEEIEIGHQTYPARDPLSRG
jgi:hypothetical protein